MKIIRKCQKDGSAPRVNNVNKAGKYMLLLAVLSLLLIWAGCRDDNTPEPTPVVSAVIFTELEEPAKITLFEGDTYTIKVRVAPYPAADTPITWTSSNPSVASVENGTLTAKAVGTTVITAEAGGKSTTCTVTVREVPLVSLDRTYVSLAKGVSTTIHPTSDFQVTWESANPSIASVSNGVITANGYGTTIITAKAGGKTATCTVTVKSAIIGVYYFDGWSGQAPKNFPEVPEWPANPPSHLTKRFVVEFSGRQPVWGWRNDTQAIMEQQIDLMADNGVDFMLYCWYWKNDRGQIDETKIKNVTEHTSLYLYQKAQNRQKIQYALLVANHHGAEIIGTSNWEAAVRHWAQYFKDPQYLHVDGKPLVVIFGSGTDTTGQPAITNTDIAKMQETARELGFENGLSIAGCGDGGINKDFTHRTHYNMAYGGYNPEIHPSAEKPYQEMIDRSKNSAWRGTEQQPYIPVINSGWDKRPWEGPDGYYNGTAGWYFTGDTPELFKSYLGDAITWMDNNPTKTPKERLTLIYAWNELGEGGWLVPTKDDPGAAKLKKIGELLKERSK